MLEKMVLIWNEELKAEGRQEGRREGEVAYLLHQLETRFAPMEEATRTRILSATSDRLQEWAERILIARTLPDVFD